MAQPTLLIIDNDPEFSHSLESEGLARGYQVISAWSSDEGEQLAHEHQPDAIVLAVELQPENGWAVCSRLKRNPNLQGIPLVLTSSSASQDTFNRHQTLAYRADHYLHKPCNPADVLDLLAAGAVEGAGFDGLDSPAFEALDPDGSHSDASHLGALDSASELHSAPEDEQAPAARLVGEDESLVFEGQPELHGSEGADFPAFEEAGDESLDPAFGGGSEYSQQQFPGHSYPEQGLDGSVDPLRAPLGSEDPLGSVDPLASMDALESADPLASVDPLESAAPLESVDPLESMDPLGASSHLESADPLSSFESLEAEDSFEAFELPEEQAPSEQDPSETVGQTAGREEAQDLIDPLASLSSQDAFDPLDPLDSLDSSDSLDSLDSPDSQGSPDPQTSHAHLGEYSSEEISSPLTGPILGDAGEEQSLSAEDLLALESPQDAEEVMELDVVEIHEENGAPGAEFQNQPQDPLASPADFEDFSQAFDQLSGEHSSESWDEAQNAWESADAPSESMDAESMQDFTQSSDADLLQSDDASINSELSPDPLSAESLDGDPPAASLLEGDPLAQSVDPLSEPVDFDDFPGPEAEAASGGAEDHFAGASSTWATADWPEQDEQITADHETASGHDPLAAPAYLEDSSFEYPSEAFTPAPDADPFAATVAAEPAPDGQAEDKLVQEEQPFDPLAHADSQPAAETGTPLDAWPGEEASTSDDGWPEFDDSQAQAAPDEAPGPLNSQGESEDPLAEAGVEFESIDAEELKDLDADLNVIDGDEELEEITSFEDEADFESLTELESLSELEQELEQLGALGPAETQATLASDSHESKGPERAASSPQDSHSEDWPDFETTPEFADPSSSAGPSALSVPRDSFGTADQPHPPQDSEATIEAADFPPAGDFELEQLKENHAQLQAQLQESAQQLEEKDQFLSETQQELAALKKEASERDAVVKSLSEKAEQMATQARELVSELETSRDLADRLAEAEAKIQRLNAELEEEQKSSQHKLVEALARAEAAEKQIEDLNTKLARAKSSILDALG